MLHADDIDTKLETESADNCLDMLLLPKRVTKKKKKMHAR